MSTQPMPDPQVSGDVGEIMEQDWNAFKGAIMQLFAKWGMQVLDIRIAWNDGDIRFLIDVEFGEDYEIIFLPNQNTKEGIISHRCEWTEILDRVDGLYQDYLKIVGA